MHKLLLISAPAGYGKTTLIVEALRELKKLAAWVSLEASDSNPANFWNYFILALQTVIPGVCQPALNALQSPQSPPAEWLVTAIINSISTLKDDLVVVLDDYHTIESKNIHEDLIFLIEHLPPRVHLVISSRIDPPLPLSRWRVKGNIAEIRADDLSFIAEESATYIKHLTGITLSKTDLAALKERTEGWVAGLKMAALSLQNQKDVSGYIRNFSGSNRYIMDYLIEEVLNQQSSNVRQFLLETSILTRLCGPLCDTVLDRNDSQTILTQLETANLFISPLDNERRWYRYHQLFADILHNQLVKSNPKRVNLLHHQASLWYAQQGLVEEAIEHALLGGDVERAIDLLENIAPSILKQGQAIKLLNYRTRFPQSLVDSRPWLCVSFAWAALLSHQWDLLSNLLTQVNAVITENPDRLSPSSRANLRHIKGHLLSIRGYIAQAQGDIARSIHLSEEANRELPSDDLTTRSANSINLAIDYLIIGEITKAIPYLEDAKKQSLESGNYAVVLSSQAYLAEIELQRSRFDQAYRICQETIELGTRLGSGSPLSHVAIAFILLGQIMYEQNDLKGAITSLAEGIQLAEANFNWTFLLKGYLTMAKTSLAQGDSETSIQFLRRAEEIAVKAPQARESHQITAWKGWLYLHQGDTATISNWIQKLEAFLPISELPNYPQEFEYLVLIRLKLTKRQSQGLPGYLDRLILRAEQQGRNGTVIEILILKALSLEQQGKTSEAVVTLDRALSLAGSAGYVRTFIDEGVPMADLLGQVVNGGKNAEFASRLRGLLISKSQDWSFHPETSTAITDTLSKREVEVLTLIGAGKSNLEIASRLFLAIGTVKKHIYNIFSKLGVDSRTQAVARARERGIIK